MKIKNFYIYFCILLATLLGSLNLRAAVAEPEFTVVIDAGHGGKDTGAVDNDIREKDVNLGTALKLADYIRKNHKEIKVVMTRSTDEFISLQGRADIANRNKADLFISIHTNSVDLKNPNRKTIAGASTYTLGLHRDQDNLNVARRENSVMTLESDYDSKYKGFDPASDESYIIFEMAQKANMAQSVKFAEAVQKQMASEAGRKDRGVKQAGFWVLWATSMPSVLVELDFITNPDVASFIGSENGQEKMARAIGKAVDNYFASLSSQRPKTTNTTGQRALAASKPATTKASSPKKQEVRTSKKNSKSSEKKDSGKSSKNKKSKEKSERSKNDNNSSSRSTGRQQQKAEASGDYDANLASVTTLETPSRREATFNTTQKRTDTASAPRRRRGSKAREKSENREYEVAVISEERSYVIAEEPVLVQQPEAQSDDDKNTKSKDKKSKKKKDKKHKDSKNKDPRRSMTGTAVSSARSGKNDAQTPAKTSYASSVKTETKKVKVEGTTTAAAQAKHVTAKQASPRKKETKKRGTSASPVRLDKRVTVYKIQILSSESHLKQSSPRFCGLKPIDCTKKGDLYKYTYGETTSETEIRGMLEEVKKLIPDAFIVTSQK